MPISPNHCNSYYKNMPSPSREEQNSAEFNAIWGIIKNWDINVPEYYNGYAGSNGSHVKLILDAIRPFVRNKKINSIING